MTTPAIVVPVTVTVTLTNRQTRLLRFFATRKQRPGHVTSNDYAALRKQGLLQLHAPPRSTVHSITRLGTDTLAVLDRNAQLREHLQFIGLGPLNLPRREPPPAPITRIPQPPDEKNP